VPANACLCLVDVDLRVPLEHCYARSASAVYGRQLPGSPSPSVERLYLGVIYSTLPELVILQFQIISCRMSWGKHTLARPEAAFGLWHLSNPIRYTHQVSQAYDDNLREEKH
jgi:hypothetical protein